jgi:anti-sigma factor RsiW
MNRKLHDRAEDLLLAALAGEIAQTDREWLYQHLDDCPTCTARSRAYQAVLQGLKSYQVQVKPELVLSTQRAVHNRARELGSTRSRNVVLWGAVAVSWVWILWSAPWLWRILDWLGNHLGLPGWAWQMAFGIWWLLPALATAAVLGIHREEQLLGVESGPEAPPLRIC